MNLLTGASLLALAKSIYYFSVKELVSFGKNSKDAGPIGPVNLRVIFPLKTFLCNTRNFCCINDT